MNKTTPGSLEVVMNALEAASKGLGEEFISSFSDELDYWFPGTTPISGRRKGLVAFNEFLQQLAGYLDQMIQLELTNVVVAGEWVFTEAVGHGVTKKGLDYDNSYCLVWQVRDGKIIRFTEYCDTELVTRVLCA